MDDVLTLHGITMSSQRPDEAAIVAAIGPIIRHESLCVDENPPFAYAFCRANGELVCRASGFRPPPIQQAAMKKLADKLFRRLDRETKGAWVVAAIDWNEFERPRARYDRLLLLWKDPEGDVPVVCDSVDDPGVILRYTDNVLDQCAESVLLYKDQIRVAGVTRAGMSRFSQPA